MNVEEAQVKYLAESLAPGDYYTQDMEHPGVWMGEGAKLLGLQGGVTPAPFARLSRNQHPFDDEQLTPRRRQKRRVGYDITFSVPKSVSLLFMVTQDHRVIDAFKTAVHETMCDIEADMHTRVRRDGASHDRHTGNMVWGEFLHLTTRPVDGTPDPLMHLHAFTFNATYDHEEHRWKAGQFGDINRRMPYYEAAFHSRVALAIESLGWATTPTRYAFEIVGIARSEIEVFSRRSLEIDTIATERGYDAEEKAELGAKTRQRKTDDFTYAELRRNWLSRLEPGRAEAIRQLNTEPLSVESIHRHDVTDVAARPQGIETNAEQQFTIDSPRHSGTSEQGTAGSSADQEFADIAAEPLDIGEDTENPSSDERQSRTFRPESNTDGADHGPNSPGPMEGTPWGLHLLHPMSANTAAKEAVRQLLERDAVVTEDKLHERAMRLGVGRASPADIEKALQDRPELVRREINGRTYVTTRDALREEKELVQFAKLGRGRKRSLGVFPISLSQYRLDGRDREVLAELLSSKDVLTLFKHTGPSEKPALSRAAMTGIQEAGYQLWVVAPNSSSARQAEKDYGIKHVHVVHTLLNSKTVQADLKMELRRRVIWVEDAGRLGTRAAAALAKVAAKAGARLVFAGDTARSRAFQRGDVFRLLRELAGLTTAERRVVRDKDNVREEALDALTQSPATAVRRMHDLGKLIIDEPDQLVDKAVTYFAEQREQRRAPLLIAANRAAVSTLNVAIREWLRASGILRGKDRSVLQYNVFDWTDRQKRDAEMYSRGMVVHFHQPSTGFKSGDWARVIGTDPLGLVWVSQGIKKPVFPLNPLHASRFTVSEAGRTHLAVGDRIRLTRSCKPKLGSLLRSGRVVTVTGFDPVGDIVVNGVTILRRRFGHFEHDYATTAASVHGRRADAVGIVLSREHGWRTEPADLINAASAGKRDFRIFADQQGTVVDTLELSKPVTSATDFAQRPEEFDLQQQAYEEQVRKMHQERERTFRFER